MTTLVVIRPGETPEQARTRLEREDWRALGTEAGQALLRQLAEEAARRRREAVRT
jgi:hypothetical protein